MANHTPSPFRNDGKGIPFHSLSAYRASLVADGIVSRTFALSIDDRTAAHIEEAIVGSPYRYIQYSDIKIDSLLASR